METKRKEKEKKRRKEKKRSEKKRICLESNSGPAIHRDKALPLGHVEHTGSLAEILLLKPSALLNVNSKIFFRRI